MNVVSFLILLLVACNAGLAQSVSEHLLEPPLNDPYEIYLRMKRPWLTATEATSLQKTWTVNGMNRNANWNGGLTPLPMLDPHASQNGALEQVWSARFASNAAPGNEYATCAVLDNEGNLFVAGATLRPPIGNVIILTKFDQGGNLIWFRLLETDGLSSVPLEVALDDSGNVVLLGYLRHTTQGIDFFIGKLDGEGNPIWHYSYNNPFNGWDYPMALALDSNDNIVVAGTSYHGRQQFENRNTSVILYLTIKISPGGEQRWISHYEGPIRISELADLVIDNEDNIIVTGKSENEEFQQEFATVKYSPDGTELWVSRYNNGIEWNEHFANAVVCDPDNNIYVAGRPDFAVIKYYPNGDKQWVSKLAPGEVSGEGVDLAFSSSGFLHATGIKHGDILTCKIDTAGRVIWQRTSEFRANPLALTVDGRDRSNIIAFGRTSEFPGRFLMQYSPDGSELWTRFPDSVELLESIDADSSGAVYVAGATMGVATGRDLAAMKYDDTGTELWRASHNGENYSNENPVAVRVASGGSIYTLATTHRSGTGSDILLLKYDTAGELRWQYLFDDGSGSGEDAMTMTSDHEDNVVILGRTKREESAADYLVLKVASNGTPLWQRFYNGPGNDDDWPWDIAMTKGGSIYISGQSEIDSEDDIKTATSIKYNGDGNQLWVSRFEAPSAPVNIEVDRRGHLHVLGTIRNEPYPASTSMILVKYDLDGDELWRRLFKLNEYNISPRGLEIDHRGDIYITSRVLREDFSYGVVTLKYSSDGDLTWQQEYKKPGSLSDWPFALRVDLSNNVYVPVRSVGTDKLTKVILLKYSSRGKLLAENVFGEAHKNYWHNYSVLAGNGNLYMLIKKSYSPSTIEHYVLEVNPEGNIVSSTEIVHPAGYPLSGKGLALDGWGGVVVTAHAGQEYSWGEVFTAAYRHETFAEIPRTLAVSQNYPNPFNASTTIRYTLETTSDVKLTIYNLRGQRVATLVDGRQAPGVHARQWQASEAASGTYLYRLQATSAVAGEQDLDEVRKLVLLK